MGVIPDWEIVFKQSQNVPNVAARLICNVLNTALSD